MGGPIQRAFTEEDAEVLVKIVKVAQGRKVEGSKGDWKKFLRVTKASSRGADPSKHSWTTLAEFVNTFIEDDDKEIVGAILSRNDLRKKNQKFESITWKDSPVQKLVDLTRQNFRHREYYNFPSTNEGWVKTEHKHNDSSSNEDHILSIDCEMVVCEGGDNELVRVCMVDTHCEKVVDMLVKPTNPVTDFLTPITGLTERDLENVTNTFIDAQTAVLNHLNRDTVLVGHSLHHDLKALKIDHLRVIDTSFIFTYSNRPETFNVGLNCLCQSVLGYKFRDDGAPHDCLADATIPMRIVEHALKHGFSKPINIPEKEVDAGDLCKLCFHGILHGVTVQDLRSVIPKKCKCTIEEISWSKNSKYGRTFVTFNTIHEANRIFQGLRGPLTQDSHGRPQKTVAIRVLPEEGNPMIFEVKVRKMSCSGKVSVSMPEVTAKRARSVGPTSPEIDQIDNTQHKEEHLSGAHTNTKNKKRRSRRET